MYLDRNLTFQEEVKHVPRKIACGIKTIVSIRNYFPMKTRLLLLNALVICHLHYPAILLNGISENLMTTLEKQLNWAIKACFNRTKIESSSDLKTKHKILSVRYLLRARSTIYYWKYRTSRERPKSAPYLRLKNSKRTSKCQVFSSTVPA